MELGTVKAENCLVVTNPQIKQLANNGMQLTWLTGTRIRLGRLAIASSGDAGWLTRHAADAWPLGRSAEPKVCRGYDDLGHIG